jgi:hypothetical protein
MINFGQLQKAKQSFRDRVAVREWKQVGHYHRQIGKSASSWTFQVEDQEPKGFRKQNLEIIFGLQTKFLDGHHWKGSPFSLSFQWITAVVYGWKSGENCGKRLRVPVPHILWDEYLQNGIKIRAEIKPLLELEDGFDVKTPTDFLTGLQIWRRQVLDSLHVIWTYIKRLF